MRQQKARGSADGRCHSQGAAERAEDDLVDRRRYLVAGKCSVHVVLVPSKHHASDHGNAERATNLQGNGIGRRSYPGVALGD